MKRSWAISFTLIFRLLKNLTVNLNLIVSTRLQWNLSDKKLGIVNPCSRMTQMLRQLLPTSCHRDRARAKIKSEDSLKQAISIRIMITKQAKLQNKVSRATKSQADRVLKIFKSFYNLNKNKSRSTIKIMEAGHHLRKREQSLETFL